MNVLRCFILLTLILAGCHVKPLPVSHPEQWHPDHGATDYPEGK